MDFNSYSSCEQPSLINELIKGIELAKQLKAQMGPEYSVQTKQILLQQIVSSYDKALFILGWGGPSSQQQRQLLPASLPVTPSSPFSTMGSPNSDDLQVGFINSYQDGKEKSKKRKVAASTWTEQVKVNSGTSTEGPPADSYSWRKYGQKDILGAKHPRSYYRCTHRNAHNCWATKQLQRSDVDPTVFDITYKGKHTCVVDCRSKSAPTSPGKRKAKPDDDLLSMEYLQDSTTALGFLNASISNTQNMDSFSFSWPEFDSLNNESPPFPPSSINNADNISGSFSPSLISPSTSGSNFFSISPCVGNTFSGLQQQEHNLEIDLAEILPFTDSTTDSPAIEDDCLLDTWIFSTDLPSDDVGYLL